MFALMSARMIGAWRMALLGLNGIVAAQLVPPHRLGLATAIIFGGVSAASVVGVPLASFIATLAGLATRVFGGGPAVTGRSGSAMLDAARAGRVHPRQAGCLSRYLP
ncbi:sugar efflux transporter [Klebsiella variicola]|nr:sugar efflux transporter [Klebsiella variicola]